jgi:hypothetical protein
MGEYPMRIARNLLICAAAAMLFVPPLASAQDLSKYRNFSLGSNLESILAQVSEKPADATVIHPAPALIQEVTWWPVKSYQTAAPTDAVQMIVFSFYNGALYRILVTYENSATQGLSPEDMVRSISAKYGPATVPVANSTPPANRDDSSNAKAIAVWQDPQYSVALSQFPLSSIFQLVMSSKQLNAQADAAAAQADKQALEDAPQIESARVKQEAADQETLRQANLKAFRP